MTGTSGQDKANVSQKNYTKRIHRIRAVLVLVRIGYTLRFISKNIKHNLRPRIILASIVAFFILSQIPGFGYRFQVAATGFPLTRFLSWVTVKLGWVESMDAVRVRTLDAWIWGILSLPVGLLLLAWAFDIINFILTIIGNLFASYAYTEKTKHMMEQEGLPHPSRKNAARKEIFVQEEAERLAMFAFKRDPLGNYHPEGWT